MYVHIDQDTLYIIMCTILSISINFPFFLLVNFLRKYGYYQETLYNIGYILIKFLCGNNSLNFVLYCRRIKYVKFIDTIITYLHAFMISIMNKLLLNYWDRNRVIINAVLLTVKKIHHWKYVSWIIKWLALYRYKNWVNFIYESC